VHEEHTVQVQQIHSSIDINAPAPLVWAILTDFDAYRRWNPYIRAARGKPTTGDTVQIALKGPSHAVTSLCTLMTRVLEPRELRWRRRHVAPGIYTTEHRFRIEALPAGGVRFHQTQQIKGLFAALFGRGSRRATEEGFHAMSHALKTRAERMHGNLLGAEAKTTVTGPP
jgi:hypothetical protein